MAKVLTIDRNLLTVWHLEKNKLQPSFENYIQYGCGRCPKFATPLCKVQRWQAELIYLRQIVLQTGLDEHIKWGAPCYTLGKHNVLMLSALTDACVVSFFDGAYLNDAQKLLQKPGPNTQASRVIRFTNVQQIESHKTYLIQLINEAAYLALHPENTKIPAATLHKPEELIQIFEQDDAYAKAFDGLTPGRQRGYLIYFNAPKTEAARVRRIIKCRDKILLGLGLQENPTGK